MKKALALLALLVLSGSAAEATTYYVRTDGLNAHTGTTNTAGGAWQTIAKGCSTAVAGDTVRVQAGTYVETASGCTSGTSGNTVTLVADGLVTTCGMSFTSKSYIRVIGFTMNPNASTCGGAPAPIVHVSGTNTGLEFWNNDFGHLESSNAVGASGATDICNKCIIIGGSLHDISSAGSVNGVDGTALIGDDNYIAYVNFSAICYVGISAYGSRGRYLNNNFSGMIQCGTYHPDFYYIDPAAVASGYSTSLVEAMFAQGTPTSDDNKIFHAENQSSVAWLNDVWRFNVVYNTGSASAFSMYSDGGGGNTSTNWKFYNSTHVYGSRSTANSGSQICGNIQNNGGGALSYDVFDTLYYECWGTNATTSILPWSTTNPTTKDYNLAFSPNHSVTMAANWGTQAHPKTNTDPLLTNVNGLDFTLQSGSPARGAGGALTTASGSGVSSTSLTVATGGGAFFVGDNSANLAAYGGALVPGDVITVGTTPAQVASVSGDVLTLASAISWSNGDSVCFGTTCTPDIGAYPYKAGGYALSATYTTNGGTASIAPNDASLVRFVVCYDSNVPIAVVNASPYTCTVGSGTFSARAYPRYASLTQSVVATAPGALTLRAIKRKVRRDE